MKTVLVSILLLLAMASVASSQEPTSEPTARCSGGPVGLAVAYMLMAQPGQQYQDPPCDPTQYPYCTNGWNGGCRTEMAWVGYGLMLCRRCCTLVVTDEAGLVETYVSCTNWNFC